MATPVRFAVVGDVHGQFSLAKRLLRELESLDLEPLDFVLQVGDIECHRRESDMATMAAPASKRRMSDFAECCLARGDWPWPTYFIGGNHECYGWLDSAGGGAVRVAPNMTYLGRAGFFPLRIPQKHAMLSIGFLSGIHREDSYYKRRPRATAENFGSMSNKAWIGFNCFDVDVLLWDSPSDSVESADKGGFDESLDGVGQDESGASAGVEARVQKFRAMLETRVRMLLDDSSAVGADDPHFSASELRFLLSFAVRSTEKRADPQQLDAAVAKLDETVAGGTLALSNFLDFFTSPRMMANQFNSEARQQKFLDRFLRKNNCDIFVTHDWPAGVYTGVEGLRGSRPMGNPIAREVVDALKPRLHVCGHMHRPYRALIRHACGGDMCSEEETAVCCVSKVGMALSVALFEYSPKTGEIRELHAPSEASLQRECYDRDGDASSDEEGEEEAICSGLETEP